MKIEIEGKINKRVLFMITEKQSKEFEAKIKVSGYTKSQILRHLILLFIKGELE